MEIPWKNHGKTMEKPLNAPVSFLSFPGRPPVPNKCRRRRRSFRRSRRRRGAKGADEGDMFRPLNLGGISMVSRSNYPKTWPIFISV